jgi:hypothetical protein
MLRHIQPRGPYHLLGWSLGGTLAAKIAALLEADGQTVAFLGLIDPFIPHTGQELQLDDWRQDFSDFMSVVIPDLKPAEVMGLIAGDFHEHAELVGSAQPSAKEVRNLLEYVISAEKRRIRERGVAAVGTGRYDAVGAGGYAAIGADELAHIFTVGRHLKTLSLQSTELSPLRVRPACWWVAARPLSDRLALARQTGHDILHADDIDEDHFAIVRADSLLLLIESTLRTTLTVSVEKAIA